MNRHHPITLHTPIISPSSNNRMQYDELPLRLATSTMPAAPASAVPPQSAFAAKPPRSRLKYVDPPLQLTTSITTSVPASAVTPRSPSPHSEDGGVKLPTSPRSSVPASAVSPQSLLPLSKADRGAELRFAQKLDEYRAYRREARNGPPAIVNPRAPNCHHFNKWEKCFDAGSRCSGPDCDRTVGGNAHFLMQCVNCGLCACFKHQRKATSHSSMHTWGFRKTGL